MFTFETLFFILLMIITAMSLKKEKGSLLSVSNTLHLRGIFALCIMTFHISATTDLFYPVFAYLGLTVVGAFFFLSGYGLMKGYLTKKDYHKGFLKKRLFSLLLPYLFMNLVYWIYYNLNEEYHAFHELFTIYFTNRNLVMYSWFIKDIIIHYLEFFLLMILFREKKERMYQCSILLFLFDFIITLLGFSNPYLINGAFAAGMIYAYKEETFVPLFKKYQKPLFMISVILAFAFRTPYLHNSRFFLIEKLILVILILSVLTAYRIENKAFAFAGKISLYIYMCHGLGKAIVRRFYGGPLFIQDLAIYIITLFLSVFFDRLFGFLNKKLNKK